VGWQGFNCVMVVNNLSNPSLSLGGKNSKENEGCTFSKIALIFMRLPVYHKERIMAEDGGDKPEGSKGSLWRD
jgi:hypothetical protein